MKNLKNFIKTASELQSFKDQESQDLLWKLICYSPKMPVRLQQQQLLDEAEKFEFHVSDPHFRKGKLKVQGFKWGNGPEKVLITHGWGSKAADFSELISRLRNQENLQIIAFDAPGNGSSEGELSNLLLYVSAVKQMFAIYGEPQICIGHSLGAMANILAVQESSIKPSLIISLAPLIRLKENFEATLNLVGAPSYAKNTFFLQFHNLFQVEASWFNLKDLYTLETKTKYLIFHDPEDAIHPYKYLKEFTDAHPSARTFAFSEAGHDKIIKDAAVIDVIEQIIREERRKRKSS